jgi:hypothetical protein
MSCDCYTQAEHFLKRLQFLQRCNWIVSSHPNCCHAQTNVSGLAGMSVRLVQIKNCSHIKPYWMQRAKLCHALRKSILDFPFWLAMSRNDSLFIHLMWNYGRSMIKRCTVEFTSSRNFTIRNAWRRCRTNRLPLGMKKLRFSQQCCWRRLSSGTLTLCRLSGSYRNFDGPKLSRNVRNCNWWLISGSGFVGFSTGRYLLVTNSELIPLFYGSKCSHS